MKKPYIRTIIGSSGRDSILILFQPYSSKAGIFESNLLRAGHYDLPLNLRIGSRTNTRLI